MSIPKHHNHEYDGGSPDIPKAVGDRYYTQDLGRDFNHLRDRIGEAIKDLGGSVPMLTNGGIVTHGAGDTLDITAGRGYAKHEVDIPNDSTIVPASKTQADIESILVEWTAQNDLAIASATLDGSTLNYIKVRYNESDSSTRDRAKKAGSYVVEKSSSFIFVVNTTAPTAYDICIATLIGTGAGQFNFGVYTPLDKPSSLIQLSLTHEIFRQAFINGNMILPQRGISFAAIANGTYSLDRWKYSKIGTMIHTITQDSDVPNAESQTSFKVNCTTADASIAAGDLCLVSQSIEGYNFAPFVGRNAVLSFWVMSEKTGTHCVAFQNIGADRSLIKEYEIQVANTWEKKKVHVTFDYSGGTWDFTNGLGVGVSFTLAVGSTFQTTPDAWQTGSYYGTANQVNVCDTIGNEFYLSQVQLNEGLIQYPFLHRDIEAELEKAQRYFEKTYDLTVAPGTVTNVGQVSTSCASGSHGHPERFSVRKRTAPTIVVYNTQTGAVGTWYDNTAAANRAYSSTAGRTGQGAITFAGVATVATNLLFGHWTADSEI